MAKSGTNTEAKQEQARRTARRADSLRANLHRRKAQTRGRSRTGTPGQDTSEG